MKNIVAVLLCLMVGLLSALCLAESDGTEAAGFLSNLSYIDDGSEDHMLDLIVNPESEEKQPIILDIHGGGFFGGTKESLTAHACVLAEAGFAVAMPNYTHMPEANFKTIVQEVFTFFHWIGDNADAYNYDLNNVFISGDSAGGYISLLTAAVLVSPELQDYYEVTPPSYAIRGYALTCPVTDLPGLRDAYDGDMGFLSFMAGKMGEAVLKDEDSFNHADLFQIIDPETFPEVWFLTTPTDTHFYPHSVALDTFLTEKGVSHVMKEYVGTEGDLVHTFNVSDPESADARQANGDLIEYLQSRIQ